ncbi:MAG TPA: selenium cofactor biosynthesis protein YqeC [Gammaproteobacteria bacterium]|nr:selenium cofactor biosynthesis protein YqeC [Gammaproteobacteria bacterium]
MRNSELLDALCVRGGIVCAVGAGGKKTTLYRLLGAWPGRAASTSTVFTLAFPADLPAHPLVSEPDTIVDEVLAAAPHHAKIAFACPSEKPGRCAGLSSAQIARCHAEGGFDLTLVKADGARMRLIKAPAEHEPSLVDGTTTILALVSARAIGRPLSARCAHRPELVSAVTGAAADEQLTPLHIARLIASGDGLLRDARDARVVPIINMADDAPPRAAAREAAKIALDLSDRYDRVVVAAMRADDAIVDVVTRAGG